MMHPVKPRDDNDGNDSDESVELSAENNPFAKDERGLPRFTQLPNRPQSCIQFGIAEAEAIDLRMDGAKAIGPTHQFTGKFTSNLQLVACDV